MNIEGLPALVTGAASGLGRAVAVQLADNGAKVVAFDRAQGEATPRGKFIVGDILDDESVNTALDAADEWGGVRVVVNCAGIGRPGKLVSKGVPIALDDFSRTIRVNLEGTVNVMRLAAARIQQLEPLGEERGVIVNTASVAAFDGQIGQLAYSASKAAVAGITLPVARELASSQIRVMTVAPGIFNTPMMGEVSEEIRTSLGNQVPHPARLGEPSEFGQLVADIIRNPMLNGEVIRLDGAIRMAPR